jgi:hypothetical protein
MKSTKELAKEIATLMSGVEVNTKVVKKGNKNFIKIGWSEIINRKDAEELVKELKKEE